MPFSNRHYQRKIGFIFIALSLLVTTINDTILNVSLPIIARELNASTSDLQWIQNAYLLVFSSFLLTMGTLSDRYGRKRFLLLGVASFAFFSLLAGFAPNSKVLILARALQGFSGAIIMPSTLSLIAAIFPEPAANRKAIAIWSAMFGLGVGIGPVLGGWILSLDVFSWKSIFYINIPFALIAFSGVALFLPESRDKSAPPADIPGVFLSILALFTLVFAIIDAGEAGWGQPRTLISLAVSFVLLSLFLLWEKRAKHPMLPLHFFRNKAFATASFSMAITLFSLMGVFFFIPQFFQGIQYYSPLETGLLMIPQAMISVIVSMLSHRVVRRMGIRRAISGGFLLGAIGVLYLGLILQADTAYPVILLGFLFLFTGIDTAMPAATMTIMGSVPEEKAGVGSAMNEMTAQIGAALGIAVMGAVVNRTYLQHIRVLDLQLSPGLLEGIRSSIFSARAALLESGLANSEVLITDVNSGFLQGLRNSMLLGSVLLLGTAILAAVLLPDKPEKINNPEKSLRVQSDLTRPDRG
ncbi:MAG: MFS transporter [Anaerolineales bacterium]|nr:MFS transporter [Anaerolineales bacterium]